MIAQVAGLGDHRLSVCEYGSVLGENVGQRNGRAWSTTSSLPFVVAQICPLLFLAVTPAWVVPVAMIVMTNPARGSSR
jgi:hypothetical protein